MADGKVVINTALDNKGFQKGVGQISGALGGLKSVVGKLGASIVAAFSVRQIVQFGTESVRAANELANALQGLKSIMEGQGRSFSAAQAFIEEYTKDGLIPATNAITAYKNLAMRGYDDSQIRQVMVALKDASAFGRQASYSMGEAVQSATEGLKNENSILVDNAGVTKNVAKMWDEYAKSIGTTSNNLTQQQKIQAEVNGILEESKYQAGDAAKVAGTFSGQLSQLSFNFNKLKVAVGNAIIPIAQQLLPVISDAVIAMTGFANSVASVVAAFFGKADITTTNEAIADSALAGADAEDKLAAGITSAAKAAKKSLAGFDELNILQSKEAANSGAGAVSGGSVSAGSMAAEANVEDTISPKIQQIVDKIEELIEPLKNIDFGPGGAAFGTLGQAVEDFGETVGEHLEWAWFNILLPLSKWTIEEGAPATVDALSAAFRTLNAAVKPVGAGIRSMFKPLKPVFEWIKKYVLLALERWRDLFDKLAKVFEEKGPEIQNIFSGIGEIIGVVWAKIEPILTTMQALWGHVFSFIGDLVANTIGYIIDLFSGWIDFFAGVFTGDFDRAFQGICSIFKGAKEFFGKTWESIKKLFSGLCAWFDENVSQPISGFFTDAWESIKKGAEDAWKGVKEAFSSVGRFFSDTFTEAWEKVKEVFSPLGKVFVDIKKGVLDGFKEVVNKLISGINNVVAVPFNGINDALNAIKGINILGAKPFAGIKTISVPQIPMLANGGVITQPTLAMMGEYAGARNNPEIVSPQSLIEQTVANAMREYHGDMVRCFDTVVSVLQEILAAVLDIESGDDVFANAVARHEAKMAIMRGGV